MRIIQRTVMDNGLSTVIRRDTEWQEYRVSLYARGITLAEYHTDDKADAISTARIMIEARAGTPAAV